METAMQTSRRSFLEGLLAGAGATSARTVFAQHEHPQVPAAPPKSPVPDQRPVATPQSFGTGVVPVVTPDVPLMPWRLENGVKVFNIAAELVRTEFLPGRIVDAWGFNGSMPGPTIEVVEGDRVRLVVENRLAEPFSMHWHGLEIPNNMDGIPGISQDPIPPGGRFVYEFTLRQNGTFFYHSHMAMQEMMGMIGLFIIHPRAAHRPLVDHDFGFIFQEWALLPNNTVPNSLAMEFNWLTINGKAGPATTPMVVKLGDRVRIRMVNLGMDHHPIHLHGHTFFVTGTEAGRIQTTAREPANTVLLGVAQARDVEFEANNEGDWHFHCHLPHHMMNQMMTMVGPMTMTHAGMRPGGMVPGMGIVGGRALDERSGAAFGRTLGVGAEAERPVPNMPLGVIQQPTFTQPDRTAPNQGMFPGYPQDMFMVMDDVVAKPETYGMRPGWSGGTMGMMTVLRVLRPELYDKIQELKAEQARRATL
jgi:FtsP/CotA-like multicopper oxidase with cupredoxin domain